jgi:hypothetical protein
MRTVMNKMALAAKKEWFLLIMIPTIGLIILLFNVL